MITDLKWPEESRRGLTGTKNSHYCLGLKDRSRIDTNIPSFRMIKCNRSWPKMINSFTAVDIYIRQMESNQVYFLTGRGGRGSRPSYLWNSGVETTSHKQILVNGDIASFGI